MSDRTDLLTADGGALSEFFHARKWTQTSERAFTAFRDEIVRQALAASPVDLDAVRREAARKALTALVRHLQAMPVPPYVINIEAFRDREYHAPAPDRVVLSDGSVVTWNTGSLHRTKGNEQRVGATLPSWFCLLSSQHTGADWDALKALAARVGGQP